ncbi:hypothetical protein BDV41DRAFT_527106 [Aspergillus transmontanensis]|uniref:Uncharacterized protein n=1 Tax=Aspergillus transmontanensis TaxID=1034304 RepID=A0A5N6W8V3_9EURO|nr:hypothetical protein BDV41DRAFT_527106 [Aspergillus transmontanensis]
MKVRVHFNLIQLGCLLQMSRCYRAYKGTKPSIYICSREQQSFYSKSEQPGSKIDTPMQFLKTPSSSLLYTLYKARSNKRAALTSSAAFFFSLVFITTSSYT